MRKITLPWLRGLICLQLCGLFVALTATGQVAHAQNNAAPGDVVQNQVSAVKVNPLDSSLWVSWFDNAATTQNLYNLSHFSKDGQFLKTFQVPHNRYFLTITFEPGDTRFYYEDATETSPSVFNSFGYVDLQTGANHKLWDTANIPGGCVFAGYYPTNRAFYNSTRKQFYLPCNIYYGISSKPDMPTRTAVFDVTTGQLLKFVDYNVLGLHPDGGKIYAARGYFDKNSTGPVNEFYDLVQVNDQTLEMTTDKPFIQHKIIYDPITSFVINLKPGWFT